MLSGVDLIEELASNKKNGGNATGATPLPNLLRLTQWRRWAPRLVWFGEPLRGFVPLEPSTLEYWPSRRLLTPAPSEFPSARRAAFLTQRADRCYVLFRLVVSSLFQFMLLFCSLCLSFICFAIASFIAATFFFASFAFYAFLRRFLAFSPCSYGFHLFIYFL